MGFLSYYFSPPTFLGSVYFLTKNNCLLSKCCLL